MRKFILITSLLLSSLLGAQCSISVQFAGTECDGDSDGFFISFDVAGDGGTSWVAPAINAEGPYDTDEIFRVGPFEVGSLDTIFFFDVANNGCEAFLVFSEPSCNGNGFCQGVAAQRHRC